MNSNTRFVAIISLLLLGCLRLWNSGSTVQSPATAIDVTLQDTTKTKAIRSKKKKHHFAQPFPGLLGHMNARPIGLRGHCVLIRFRGNKKSFSVAEGVEKVLQPLCQNITASKATLRVGLGFVESPNDGFSSFDKNEGVFELFRWLEFLLAAYQELHTLAAACPAQDRPIRLATLRQGNPRIQVPWIYVPTLRRSEICGPKSNDVRCIMADLVLHATVSTVRIRRGQALDTQVFGLEANEDRTREYRDEFRGIMKGRTTSLTAHEQVASTGLHQEMIQKVEAVLFLNREGCNADSDDLDEMMWDKGDGSFPVDHWHADAWRGLGRFIGKENEEIESDLDKLVVCEVTFGPDDSKMPRAYRKWLTSFWSSHKDDIEVLSLQMHNFDSVEVMKLAASCQLWIGSHSTAMVHQLWMKPQSFVLEFFWLPERPSLEYKALSDTMRHRYLSLLEGQVMNAENGYFRSENAESLASIRNRTGYEAKVSEGFDAIEKFLQDAILEQKTKRKQKEGTLG